MNSDQMNFLIFAVLGSILRVGGHVTAPRITTEENDPVGSPKSDQKGGSDRFCRMNDRFFCLTFLIISIQRIPNSRKSNY
jgi:hypothetical protein